MQAFGIVAIVAVVGLLGFLFFTGYVKVTERPSPANCAPSEVPAPSGAYKSEAKISLYDGKFLPNRLEVSGPVIFLSVTSFGSQVHNVILASVKNCKEQELRRLDGMVNFETRNIRISLPPGEYLLYCDIRQGKSSHRENGEIAKVIVH